jgi:cytochrome c oxidase subunit 2
MMALLRNVGRGLPLGVVLSLAAAQGALAGMGQPSPWQLGLQQPATEIAANINWFHDVVNIVIFLITAFVLVLLAIVIFRFGEKANPKPSKLTHHTGLEVAWTVIPIFILVAIAIPSFKLLYRQYDYPKPDLTIKAVGHQWYWSHEYPDHGGIKFDSVIVRDEDLVKREIGDAAFKQRYGSMGDFERQKALYVAAQPLWAKNKMVRLLSTDNDVVVPVGKVVHVVVTAADVIHNWTVPSFGSKVDAVPGRTTATWFKADKKGTFYGQCSELCGKDHAFMPISVRVVDQPVFDEWATAMKARDRRKAREILEKAAAEDAGAKVASR